MRMWIGNEDVTYPTFTEGPVSTESLNVTRTKDGCSTVLITRGHTSVMMVNEYIAMAAVIKILQYYLRLVHFSTSMCLYTLNPSPPSHPLSFISTESYCGIEFSSCRHSSFAYYYTTSPHHCFSECRFLSATSFIFESILLPLSFFAHLR
jgi:hypothetical protein